MKRALCILGCLAALWPAHLAESRNLPPPLPRLKPLASGPFQPARQQQANSYPATSQHASVISATSGGSQAARHQLVINSQAPHLHHHHQHHLQQPQQQQQHNLCQRQTRGTECWNSSDEALKSYAMLNFQHLLASSSLELRNLIELYWDEFRTLSLDLIQHARNNTLIRIGQSQVLGQHEQHLAQYEATRRLFDAMHAHLASHEPAEQPPGRQQQEAAGQNQLLADQARPNVPADPELLIAGYFRRLHLIQVKRRLDQRLAGQQNQSRVDLECLSSALGQSRELELELHNELASGEGQQALALEQVRLSQSMKQSLEFARTLLSSVGLAKEMLHNLTTDAAKWMPHSRCHEALVKLTMCPHCQPAEQANQTARLMGKPAPCEGYCLNVMRGCMHDLYELNRFWNEHISALVKFKRNLIQTNNIENVMSNLDEKLHFFITNLSQQYQRAPEQQAAEAAGAELAPSSSNMDHRRADHQVASKMIELCAAQKPAGRQRLQAGRPAGKLMPPSQTPPAQARGSPTRHASLVLRSRATPSMSLFNRLESFVHELSGSRDFFQDWPTRVCQTVRQRSAQPSAAGARARSGAGSTGAGPTAETACWNGVDFGGYAKPVLRFSPIPNPNHPEVPLDGPGPYNGMMLHFVGKLKSIGALLAHKSTRSPSFSSIYQPGMSQHSAEALHLESIGLHQQADLQQQQQQRRPQQSNPIQTERPDVDSLISAAATVADQDDSDQDKEDAHELVDESQDQGDIDDDSAEDGTEEPDVHCSEEDCRDLFTSVEPGVLDNSQTGPPTSNAPNDLDQQQQQPTATIDMSPPLRIPQQPIRGPNHLPKYQFPSKGYESPQGSNDIYPLIHMPLEPQTSSASAWFVSCWLQTLLALLATCVLVTTQARGPIRLEG